MTVKTGSGMNRRTFAVTGIATGFALSVQPVEAGAITTDATGLVTGQVKIPVTDGEIPAYRAQPATGSNHPVVLVVHEIFGVHEWIQDICRRFAKLGYLAVAPHLYARLGDPTKYTDIRKLVSELVSKVDDNTVMTDLDATASWAAANGGNASKLGVTGFCWGGRVTWLYTAHNPKVTAGVAWYGHMVRGQNDTRPRHPVEVAGKLKGRVLGLYGALDKGIQLTQVEAMRAALKAAGDKKSEIIVYNDADHGFLADYRTNYNEAVAKAAWARCLSWFRDHGM